VPERPAGPADAEVLIAGAGPTGLVLALRLARAGIRVRIVDAAAEPGTTSRAIVVHARTLELYRQMGIADGAIAEGFPFRAANLWVRARRVARVPLGEIGTGLSPYPFMLVLPQDLHERFLGARLAELGVAVERGTELVDFAQDASGVRARLRGPGGVESDCHVPYLAGCDGAHSRVREVLGVGFAGRTYSHLFFVADIDAAGEVMNGELHIALDESDLLGIFPLRGGRTGRLIGTVKLLEEHDGSEVTWEQVGRRGIAALRIEVERVNWFSTYRVHHRVAERFADRRVLLLGDAAHIHSPVGAQGMNTGIGDAANLSWKLADVLRGRAGERLLETYEPERIAFARRLVATTDRAFVLATSPGRIARWVRTRIVPRAVPFLFRRRAFRRIAFRTLSQIAIRYRGNPVARGRAGGVSGGDRLPWVMGLEGHGMRGDNHEFLDGLEWRVHVYGEARPELERACLEAGWLLERFRWRPEMAARGLAEGALYLIRPDGHVAWSDSHADPEALARFLAKRRPDSDGSGSSRPRRSLENCDGSPQYAYVLDRAPRAGSLGPLSRAVSG